MNLFKAYIVFFTEIAITFILLLFLILMNPAPEHTAELIITMMFVIIYDFCAIRYFGEYTNKITVNRRINEKAKAVLNIVCQSAAHIYLGIVIMDYVYIYLKKDLYCFAVLLLSIILSATDFLIRYKRTVGK